MRLLAMLSAIALIPAEFVRGEVRTLTKHASRPDLVTQGSNATFANYIPGGARVATDFAGGITGAEVRHGITDHAIHFSDVVADGIGRPDRSRVSAFRHRA